MWSISGPIIGALIGASVALYIHFRSQPRRRGLAYKVMKELGRKTNPAKGEFYHSKSAGDNYEIAQHLYKSDAVAIIGTAFHEDPAKYGENDLVRSFHGRDFTRITCENVCTGASPDKAASNLKKAHAGGCLVILPATASYVRIDGMFCKFRDDTYLCFVAFRNPTNPEDNCGILFRDDIAVSFFDYYSQLAKQFGEQRAGTDAEKPVTQP